MKATATITCEGSEREITINASQQPGDAEIKVNIDFDPPFTKEDANDNELPMNFLLNCFIRGIKREELL